MERNEETLSTRDLASANDPETGEPPSSHPGVRDGERSSDAPAEVYDREAMDRETGDGGAPSGVTDREMGEGEAPAGVTGREIGGREAPAGVTDREIGDGEAPSGVPRDIAAATPGAQSQPQEDVPGQAAPASPAGPSNAGAGNATPLLAQDVSTTFQRRWEEVQTRFVDEPRGAVEDADGLVASLMQQLAEGFAQERERLEAQWGRGEDISTEDLRIALQRYRSFFQRLLST